MRFRSWFNVFTSGSGIETDDGTVVTLLEVQRDRDSGDIVLDLLVRKAGNSERIRVRAGGEDDGRLVMLEVPAAHEFVLALHGWRDDSCIAVWYQDRRRLASGRLHTGVTWDFAAPAPFALRLEDAMPSAAPVFPEGSSIVEIVLVGPERRVRIREGEAVRLGDALVRFTHHNGGETTASTALP